MKKEYLLKNVFPYHSAWGALVAIPYIIIWGLLYYWFFGSNFRLGFVMIFSALCFGTCAMLIKFLSKDILIWFNDDFIIIKKGNNTQKKYLKKDVLGFYSYNYETKSTILRKSLIKFKICLQDGQKIYFNDSEYKSKYEEVKGEELKKLLDALKKELGFKEIRSKKYSNIYWYSNTSIL